MKRYIFRLLTICTLFALTFSTNALDLPKKVVKGREVYYYNVSNNESVYGISKKLGIPREDIVRHNPSAIDGVKRGMMLYFPVDEYSETVLEEIPETVVAINDTELVPEEEPIAKNPTITLLLPFGLNSEEPSRENRLALDFYKGFLIGADTLCDRRGNIDIHVIDTDDKSTSFTEILKSDAVKNATIIVAPSDASKLRAIADSAAINNTFVLNVFVMHDSLYLTNPRMLQANIPQKAMYKLATDALLSQYDGYIPVILRNKEGKNEKAAFVNYVSERYSENGIEPLLIEYENNLLFTELETLPVNNNERYVFIPTSGSLAEFNRFAYVIKSLRDKLLAEDSENPDNVLSEARSRIEIYGYPDWTAFRGDALETLHKLGATVYSRFNDNFNDFSFRNIENNFKTWFGCEITESIPCQALLGYDTACLLIKNLHINNGEFNPTYPQRFEGIQSTYDFEKTDEGFCNATLYIITYLPGGRVDARTL